MRRRIWRPAAFAATVLGAGVAAYLYLNSGIRKEPGFHERSCWFKTDVVGETRCGHFVVRENRDRPNGRTISLPVVILAAQGEKPHGEPIVFLNGGPGDRMPMFAQQEIDSWSIWREDFPLDQELILVGLRGTGLETADFDCPELKGAGISLGAHAPDTEGPDVRSLMIQGVLDCGQRLSAEGVDLTAYNSRESAADIAELRQALAIESWSLYGVSYGTRLALSVLRYHPEGVRAVVLDGVVPPEAAEGLEVAAYYRDALGQVFKDCAASQGCARQFGDLEARYDKLIQRFKARPLTLSLADYLDPEELASFGDADGRVITFDHTWFDGLLLNALLEPQVPLLVPILIDDIEQNRAVILKDRLRETLRVAMDSNRYNSWAVYLSHVCRDEASFETASDITAAAKAAGELAYYVEDYASNYLCAHWPAGAADAVENSPVKSTVPTLLLSGRFDPLTPPQLARQAAENLSNSHVFTLAALSHGALYENTCARHLVSSFLRSLERPTETRCKPQDLVVRLPD